MTASKAVGGSGWVIVAALVALGACDGPVAPHPDAQMHVDGGPGMDGGARDAGGACAADDDCDDGLFCSGEEACDPSSPDADARGCVAGPAPCTGEGCVEDEDACDACAEADADGDGHDSIACGGDDCDDDDGNRFPGNTEVCDTEHHDEDCDPSTFGFRDVDGDSYPDASCCNLDSEGAMQCGDDCNDARPNVHPSLGESCDALDNDCDGAVDEEVLETFYVDADGDMYGDASLPTVSACLRPSGYSDTDGDCDDTRATVSPAAPELCDTDARDEDCDGVANPESLCMCAGDISRACLEPGRCAAGMQRCVGGSWGACSIGPSMELCNGEDDDCDGRTDESGPDRVFYLDGDGDGYGVSGSTTLAALCVAPEGYSVRSDDCDDGDDTMHPDAPELCDRVDSNCSSGGGTDAGEDADGDGHAAPGHACAGGTLPKDDCDDTRADVFPGACEQWNDRDDDCDGSGDEGTGCPNGRYCASTGVCTACGAGSLAGDCGAAPGCETNLSVLDYHCGGCGISCGSGQVCLGGVCRSGSVRRVFMAPSLRSGGFGGLTALDNLCMDLVNEAMIYRGRTWRAWASDATSSPSTRFAQSSFDYVLMDGTVIANGWSDLTDGTLDNPINRGPTGAPMTSTIWTGTTSSGASSGASCNNWSSSSSGVTGTFGTTSATTGSWTAASTAGCGSLYSFYCFEQ